MSLSCCVLVLEVLATAEEKKENPELKETSKTVTTVDKIRHTENPQDATRKTTRTVSDSVQTAGYKIHRNLLHSIH